MPTPYQGCQRKGMAARSPRSTGGESWLLLYVEHGKDHHDEARARRYVPTREKKLITFAKRRDMHRRRQVLTVIPDKAWHNLFTEIGRRCCDLPVATQGHEDRPRKGDAAPGRDRAVVQEKRRWQRAWAAPPQNVPPGCFGRARRRSPRLLSSEGRRRRGRPGDLGWRSRAGTWTRAGGPPTKKLAVEEEAAADAEDRGTTWLALTGGETRRRTRTTRGRAEGLTPLARVAHVTGAHFL